MRYRLIEVFYPELGKYLLGFQLGIIIEIHSMEASFEHGSAFRKLWFLSEIPHFYPVSVDDSTGITTLIACKHGEKCRFSCSILRNKTDALTLSDGERYVLKEHSLAKSLADVLDI